MKYTNPDNKSLKKRKISQKAKATIAALLATVGLTISGNYSSYSPEITHSDRVEDSDSIERFKNDLQAQFQTSSVTLSKDADEFVTSVFVDDNVVTIELSDGTQVSGPLENLGLNQLHLSCFHASNSEYLKAKEKMYLENDFSLLLQASQTKREKNPLCLTINDVSVEEELKITSNSSLSKNLNDFLVKSIFHSPSFRIHQCKNVWLDSFEINQEIVNVLNQSSAMERLYLTKAEFYDKTTQNLTLNIPSLKTVIVDQAITPSALYDFDFTKCSNLHTFSMGNTTQIENLEGLKGLSHLTVVDFSNFIGVSFTSILGSFEDMENSIVERTDPTDFRLSKSNNNLIHDLNGIKNSNVETIDISSLSLVSSEEFYDVVTSLPHLKNIIGLEVNNADMCSENLIEYCEEHGITHPFTEKSLEIKNELRRIVAELTTPQMDDWKKVEVLSKYLMNTITYDMDGLTEFLSSETTSPSLISKDWGESLYYTIFQGEGVCAGYAKAASALFKEAGVKSFRQETAMHVFNYVEIDGVYYQLDLTQLDQMLEQTGISVDDFSYEMNSLYYMTPPNSENNQDTTPFQKPYEVQKQEEATIKSEHSKEKTLALLGIFSAIGIASACSKIAVDQWHQRKEEEQELTEINFAEIERAIHEYNKRPSAYNDPYITDSSNNASEPSYGYTVSVDTITKPNNPKVAKRKKPEKKQDEYDMGEF